MKSSINLFGVVTQGEIRNGSGRFIGWIPGSPYHKKKQRIDITRKAHAL